MDNITDPSEYSIWKGYDIHGPGQNNQFIMASDKLPKCFTSGKTDEVIEIYRPNYYKAQVHDYHCVETIPSRVVTISLILGRVRSLFS